LQGQPLPRPVERSAAPNPLTATYRTRDGRFIQLMFLQADRYWPDFCRALGRADLIDDLRFANMAVRRANSVACIAELDQEFGARSFAECKQLLGTIDVPWAPVQRVDELLDDPQVIANGYIGEVPADEYGPGYRLPAVPVQFDGEAPKMRRAPELGQDTETILLELGYSWETIAELNNKGVIP
jgi:crotonobetainyl-CoA:carnitine CoA-transferase CaiB-like acyl-CoA transferase